MADAKKGDGRGVLILTDGTQAPVSRSHYARLREAGWFLAADGAGREPGH